MKKYILSFIAVFLFVACNSSLETKPNKQSNKVGATGSDPTLSSSMQGLKNNLTHLLPIVLNQKKFNLPDHQSQISEEIKNLYQISKTVEHTKSMQETDPSLRFISTAFTDDLRRAQEGFASGQKEFARYTVINVTAYCIECHTRTSSGPTFSTPQLEKAIVDLRKIEKAEYHLATRQFDQALQEFESAIRENLQEKGNLFELDKAVRYALAITIRFQKNPEKSLKIVRMVKESNRSPYFLKQSAMAWDLAIQKWQKEKSSKMNLKTPVGINDALKVTQRLVDEGRKSQYGIADRGGDIYFLRALSDLHLILARDMNKEQLGQALLLTAISFEAIRDLSLWSLHESYYESCIRQVPHSKWSSKCYQNLEESIYFGYSGSSGVQIPLDVQMKLSELKKLALLD